MATSTSDAINPSVGGLRLGREAIAMAPEVTLHLVNLTLYEEKVLPAYRRLLKRNEAGALINLLQECAEKLNTNPELSQRLLWDKESVDEAIGILNGTVYYSPDGGRTSNQGKGLETNKVRRAYAKGLSSNLVEILCVPHGKGVTADQDMTNTPLISFLCERSKWINDVFTFARPVDGGRLEFSIGESSEILTKQNLEQFSLELKKIPLPDEPELKKEYEHLRDIVTTALETPELTLALSVI